MATAVIQPNGNDKVKIQTASRDARLLLTQFFKENPDKTPRQETTVTLSLPNAGTVNQTLSLLKKPGNLGVYHKDPKTGVENYNSVLSPVLASLIEGNAQDIPQKVKNILPGLFRNEDSLEETSKNKADLTNYYRVFSPEQPELAAAINGSDAAMKTKRQLLGLSLYKKAYQGDIEWKSVAVSAALGAAGEPFINSLFPGGGETASKIRTGFMSFLDIMGNVLSTFGMAGEKLDEMNKKFSLSDPTASHLLKSGLISGGIGGLGLGVPMNYPAGAILSEDNASVFSRAAIGGMSAAGSAVAIPQEVHETQKEFQTAIKQLIQDGWLKYPGIAKTKQEKDQFIQRLANQEMNLRLNTAASIKATNPMPLVGTGFATLFLEKLGVPRSVVQTLFMATAPVMHNVLRLGYAVREKSTVIPKRMAELESMVYDPKAAKLSEQQRQQKIDDALLSNKDNTLTNRIGNRLVSYGAAVGMLGLELALLFSQRGKLNALAKSAEKMAGEEERSFTPPFAQSSGQPGYPLTAMPPGLTQVVSSRPMSSYPPQNYAGISEAYAQQPFSMQSIVPSQNIWPRQSYNPYAAMTPQYNPVNAYPNAASPFVLPQAAPVVQAY